MRKQARDLVYLLLKQTTFIVGITSYIHPVGKTTYRNDELGTNDGFSFEFQDGDSSFEDLFRKIETIQSRVRELISRAEKVVSGNLGNTSSINRSSRVATLNAPVSTAQNPAAPESGSGLQVDSLCIATQRASSERNMGDLLMLESAVSSHGEVTPHSETIGSTDQLQVGHLLANVGSSLKLVLFAPIAL